MLFPRIGTDATRYEHAIDGQKLSEYPGSDKQKMVAKIGAGPMGPTVMNLRQPMPNVLTELLSAEQFNRRLKEPGSECRATSRRWS